MFLKLQDEGWLTKATMSERFTQAQANKCFRQAFSDMLHAISIEALIIGSNVRVSTCFGACHPRDDPWH